MRESILSKLVMCDRCNKAFIPQVGGDNKTCDECLSEEEIIKDLDYDADS